MIIIKREFTKNLGMASQYKDYEFKVFTDDDITGVQKYLSDNKGSFTFTKL